MYGRVSSHDVSNQFHVRNQNILGRKALQNLVKVIGFSEMITQKGRLIECCSTAITPQEWT